jgi:putative ABC transport system permease protein
VINETGARQLNLADPVGKEIRWEAYDTVITGRVIGVMKDFHFQSFHRPVAPLMFVLYPAYNHLVIKLNTRDFENKLAQIRNVYSGFDNTFEFEFSFLDDRINLQYESEKRTGIVFSVFAIIAVAIACFGLFGMAMLNFTQRTKEVSIRKVLGATATGLLVLLLSDFTKLILLAIVVATPIAWWMMDNWLDNFTFQVGIHPAIFLISGLLLITTSWITLSYLTFKTSRLNPAETLKNE